MNALVNAYKKAAPWIAGGFIGASLLLHLDDQNVIDLPGDVRRLLQEILGAR